MRAVEISKPGGPGVLRVVERPTPEPKAGEVLVAIHAAGVSRADAMQRLGTYPPPPGASDIPGLECAGALGSGEPVCALLTGGGYAQYAAVPLEQLLPVPENWSSLEAATLPENMFTVYDNLITRGRFERGQTVLVHGGTSGIGSTAIMLARALGASFIAATARSERKREQCLSIGADLAIDSTKEDFVQRLASATGGRGVDIVVDIVGGDFIDRDLQALAFDGRIVCIAAAAAARVQIDLSKVLARRATILGSSLRARTPAMKGVIAKALLRDVWPLLPGKDAIRPLVDSVYPLEEAAAAHERLEQSAHFGKIVLSV
ncbi:MAG: NAD(P)H-quinone oxidoreductase [Candidatus Baltobacteraceae bacterium]